MKPSHLARHDFRHGWRDWRLWAAIILLHSTVPANLLSAVCLIIGRPPSGTTSISHRGGYDVLYCRLLPYKRGGSLSFRAMEGFQNIETTWKLADTQSDYLDGMPMVHKCVVVCAKTIIESRIFQHCRHRRAVTPVFRIL